MPSCSGQNRREVQHGVPRDQLGIALYRIKIMQIRMAFKLLVSWVGFREAFISNDDPFVIWFSLMKAS